MKLQLPRRGDSSDMAFIEFVDRFIYLLFHNIIIIIFIIFYSSVKLFFISFREGELRKARPVAPKKEENLLEELD